MTSFAVVDPSVTLLVTTRSARFARPFVWTSGPLYTEADVIGRRTAILGFAVEVTGRPGTIALATFAEGAAEGVVPVLLARRGTAPIFRVPTVGVVLVTGFRIREYLDVAAGAVSLGATEDDVPGRERRPGGLAFSVVVAGPTEGMVRTRPAVRGTTVVFGSTERVGPKSGLIEAD